jgi:hypothetical protein
MFKIEFVSSISALSWSFFVILGMKSSSSEDSTDIIGSVILSAIVVTA